MMRTRKGHLPWGAALEHVVAVEAEIVGGAVEAEVEGAVFLNGLERSYSFHVFCFYKWCRVCLAIHKVLLRRFEMDMCFSLSECQY